MELLVSVLPYIKVIAIVTICGAGIGYAMNKDEPSIAKKFLVCAVAGSLLLPITFLMSLLIPESNVITSAAVAEEIAPKPLASLPESEPSSIPMQVKLFFLITLACGIVGTALFAANHLIERARDKAWKKKKEKEFLLHMDKDYQKALKQLDTQYPGMSNEKNDLTL
jgi:hypothetical protein